MNYFVFILIPFFYLQMNGQNNQMMQQSILQLVRNNKISAVEQSLKSGADVNTVDGKKQSLLLIATRGENYDMAVLLVKNGADVNKQDEIQDSPFLFAGASGQTKLLELFLAHGARFDVFNRYHGTALIPACERGHIETVKLLAGTKGFPINHVNRLGWTALLEAVVLGDGSSKYQQVVKILKTAGANPDIPDRQGVTALQHARTKGFTEIVRLLESR